MKSHANRASERYLLLAQQIADEHGRVRGWKVHVAETLGIHRSYVTRLAGARSDRHHDVGLLVVERAIAKLDLDPAFFYGDHADAPHYRAFLRKPSVLCDARADSVSAATRNVIDTLTPLTPANRALVLELVAKAFGVAPT